MSNSITAKYVMCDRGVQPRRGLPRYDSPTIEQKGLLALVRQNLPRHVGHSSRVAMHAACTSRLCHISLLAQACNCGHAATLCCPIGIKARSYRELDIVPSVLLFPPTIGRTARISVLPDIEPNLAEHARISAINLDDYQLDLVTPPPSPSSPHSDAAYQRMIVATYPALRKEALTAYGMETGQGSVLVPETDVKPRVEESSLEALSVDELITQLRQVCEDAEDRAGNAQEEARQKRKEALEEVKMASGRRPTVRRNPLVNRSTNRNNVDINNAIDTQMLNKLIATRVVEALAAAAVTHATSTQEKTNLGSNSSQNKACNYKELRAVMHENFHGTEGAVGLTRWFEKLESQFGISNVAEGDRVKFASSTLLDGALTW
ncbi:hypothetical protein Tco_0181048 [Tanacetum coccineum]